MTSTFDLVISFIYTLCGVAFLVYTIISDITLRTSILFAIAGLLCFILSRLWLFEIKLHRRKKN